MMWDGGPSAWWPVIVLGALLVTGGAGWLLRASVRAAGDGQPGHRYLPGAPVTGGAPNGPAAVQGEIRASDAERGQVIGQLQQHTGEGRLTLEEFEVRAQVAAQARTRSQLSEVVRDLPPLGVRERHRDGRHS